MSRVRLVLLIAACWVAFVLAVLAARVDGTEFIFSPRWDGVHYLSIAARGYYLEDCGAELVRRGWTLCGNPWFPGWPYWNQIFSWLTRVPIAGAFFLSALLFSMLCVALPLRCAAVLLRDDAAPGLRAPELVLCALFAVVQPGSFYGLTHFPYAFVVSLSWLYLAVLYRSSAQVLNVLLGEIALFVLGTWTALSYPSAAWLAIFPLLQVWERRRGLSRTVLLAGWRLLPFCLGFVILGAIFAGKFGDGLLFFHHSAQYGRTGRFPLLVIAQTLRRGPLPEALTFLWYGVGITAFASRRGRLRVAVGVYLLWVYLFSPLTGTAEAVYRHYLLLFPLGPWVACAPRPRWLKLAFLGGGALTQLLVLLPRYYLDHLE